MGTGSPVPEAPSSDTPWESQAKFRVGTVSEGPVSTGSVRQSSGIIQAGVQD